MRFPAIRLAVVMFAVVVGFLLFWKILGAISGMAFLLIRFVLPVVALVAIVMYFVGKAKGQATTPGRHP